MVAIARIPVRMSVDEFLDWVPGDGQAWQLVDGEPQAMSPAKRTHGMLQNELGALLRNHLLERGGPCAVATTPGVVPHVQANFNMRIPDLAVTCTEYEMEEAALSNPVLIVEILSSSNQTETWSNVWTYTTIPSVQEILVLFSIKIGADLLRRRKDGSWPQEPERITDGELILESIGFRTPLADIYRTTRLHRRLGE